MEISLSWNYSATKLPENVKQLFSCDPETGHNGPSIKDDCTKSVIQDLSTCVRIGVDPLPKHPYVDVCIGPWRDIRTSAIRPLAEGSEKGTFVGPKKGFFRPKKFPLLDLEKKFVLACENAV